MNTTDKPADCSAGASATPPLATQLFRAEQKHQTGNSSRQQKLSELQQPPTHFTHSQESINANLRKLSDSLSAFQQCFGELHQHIDSVQTSIDSFMLLILRPPPHTTNTISPAAALSAPSPETEPSDPSEEEEEEEEKGEEQQLKSPPRSKRESLRPEVEILCETMNSHGLRKYMIRRLSCVKTLKQKVPKALKLSPNPARLILESMSMFYSQGSKAYVEGSPLITKRRALVLLLECFLKLMGEIEGQGGVVEIENGVKEEAEQGALAWYRRLNFEGGILKAQEIDSRGLLLLFWCFGIPQAFRNEDMKDLLHQSYIKMISDSLRRSSILMAKIQEIIDGMLKQNMVVEAVYFAFVFGFEDRFNPQRLLTSFLHESEVSLLNKLMRFEQMEASQGSLVRKIIEVKRRYLGGLKSVIQCLGRNNIEHSKLLPEWQIGRKVISLEKELAQLRKKLKGDQRIVQKKKIDETEWLSDKEQKLSHFPNPWPPPQQRVVNHVDRNITLLEGGGTAGHIYGHSVFPLVLHGPVAGSIHENAIGLLAEPVGGVAVAGPGAGISANVDGIHAGVSAGTYVLSQVGGSHGDATVYDRLPSRRYAYRPSSYLEGPNAYSRPPPYMENSKGCQTLNMMILIGLHHTWKALQGCQTP